MIELKFCVSQAKLHNETKYFTKDFTSYCIISELRGVLKSISERICTHVKVTKVHFRKNVAEILYNTRD